MTSVYLFGNDSYSRRTPSPTWTNLPRESSAQYAPARRGNIAAPNTSGIGSGFASDMPQPVLQFQPSLGRAPPLDLYIVHRFMLVISARCKDVFTAIDEDAFVFRKALVQTASGDAPQYWVADITRHLDALDEERSEPYIEHTPGGMRHAAPNVARESIFRRKIVGSAHVFRGSYDPRAYCDDDFRDACVAARLTGTSFLRIGHVE